jgi:hypothetical protein
MKIAKNRTMATLIALFLTFAMIASLVALPAATAQPTRKTYAVIGATPNLVGVGQETLIWLGITDALATVADGWEGLTVTVTRPDGTTETLGPFRTDSTGSTGTVYVPTIVGNYTLQTHFPEQEMPSAARGIPAGTTMLASDSEKLTLVVQEEPIKYYPGVPLPTEYWTRPIDAQLREWSSIAGNWLQFVPNKFAPYNDGPETGHILWAKTLVTGGLAGGELGGEAPSFESGDAYEGKFGNPVIIAGVLYYNRFEARMPTQEVVAVDLHTGEELWCRPLLDPDGVSRRLAFGQVFYWKSFNYQGVFAYLWTTVTVAGVTTWHAYNPFTGDRVYSMTNVPLGTNLYGSKGEIYRYTVDLARGWMTLWNSSRVVTYGLTGMDAGSWRPHGRTYDAARGISTRN